MGKSREFSNLTKQDFRNFEGNPNVQRVSDKRISYSPAFKVDALKAYHEGKAPMEIYVETGFEMEVIGLNTHRKCLQRSCKIYAKVGETDEQRGKGSTGRKPSEELSTEEKLKRAEARIKLLEAEQNYQKSSKRSKDENVNFNAFQTLSIIINHTIRLRNASTLVRGIFNVFEIWLIS